MLPERVAGPYAIIQSGRHITTCSHVWPTLAVMGRLAARRILASIYDLNSIYAHALWYRTIVEYAAQGLDANTVTNYIILSPSEESHRRFMDTSCSKIVT
ncbi:hypothetical protein J6590_008683 [Homalodisca vitripennis]|nr:hypothetical protein J6590_008680 [Homalodisca vitripennis]KAG8259648.1 hypothetical protein J6590_008683 [Homalodisca vitripennis]